MSIVFGLYQLLTNESFYYESDVQYDLSLNVCEAKLLNQNRNQRSTQ